MEDAVNDLFCCPSCKGRLVTAIHPGADGREMNGLSCKTCLRHYERRGGNVDFLTDEEMPYRSSRDRAVRKLYARIYTPAANLMFLFCGGAARARNEVLERLSLKKGDRILETGMGYGENFLWLDRHMKGLSLFGIDIQNEMIEGCRRNLLKWNIKAEIARANAQDLPFSDGMFDVVFHLGAINLFEDIAKAVREMIRVARPGSHIVIADETEKAARLFRIFTGPVDKVVPPTGLIPLTMKNITINEIWRGYGYVIEFDTV
jgi:ubiquinone/menaquinone biosynthesis C-methylase UbiE